MIRRTREQRDAEARNAGPTPGQDAALKPTRRGRKLGKVVDTRSTDDLMTKAAANPAMHGHLLPPAAHVAHPLNDPSDD